MKEMIWLEFRKAFWSWRFYFLGVLLAAIILALAQAIYLDIRSTQQLNELREKQEKIKFHYKTNHLHGISFSEHVGDGVEALCLQKLDEATR